MHAQDVVRQSTEQAQKIAEGAGLNLAFRSEPGQVILASVLERFGSKLERLLFDKMKDEDVLRSYYELRGMMDLCEDMGDSIRQATQIVGRSTIQQKLRQHRRQEEES